MSKKITFTFKNFKISNIYIYQKYFFTNQIIL